MVLSDPGRAILGPDATFAAVAAYNRHLGLDDPVFVQFVRYVGHVLSGNIGQSYAYQGKSVWSLVAPALLVSAVIAVLTVLVSIVVSLPLGVIAARYRGKAPDYLVRSVGMVGLSAPSAFVGLVLIRLIAVDTGILPAGGWGTSPFSDVRYLILPVATLTIYLSPILIRIVRERAIFVLGEPYVEAATARGVPRFRVLIGHVVPNSIGPLLTVVGSNFGGLVSGSVIADVVFGLPGLGNVLNNATGSGDLPVIQGVALVAGLMVTLANVTAETLQRLIDPRLRS
jgi:peptide/nickel transport system permease protein